MAHERAGAHTDGVSALQTPAYSTHGAEQTHQPRRRRRNLRHDDRKNTGDAFVADVFARGSTNI